jgi:conjugal transfer pilus assembly protein TraB
MAEPAEKKPLSPRSKKALLYSGLALVGAALVYVTTLQTDGKKTIREPENISLTGNADTRSVSIEGLNRRLADLETSGMRDAISLQNEINRLETTIGNLALALDKARSDQKAAIDTAVSDAIGQVGPLNSSDLINGSPLVSVPEAPDQTGEVTPEDPATSGEPAESAAERAERLAREQAEIERRESIYVAPDAPPMEMANASAVAAPAPRIAVYAAAEPEADPEADPLPDIPDLQIPAGSILSAFLLTGVDAPTGTRASSQPVPVLMRIKKDAIMPNYAFADVRDCHLLGSAYGDLGSGRVNIRGEVVSCVLRDNTAIEGSVKFFVTGEDGKNGIKGTVVSRSGRVFAAAAGAALAQGLVASLDDSSSESVFVGGSGDSGGAIDGASAGFDLLTEYYIDLAEQTFPVIEITNGRWVDVVLTEMLTIKFKG